MATEQQTLQKNEIDSRLEKLEKLKKLEKLAWYMDRSIALPGGFRIGLDGLIGLIPGIGDIATFLVSAYIVNEARRLGVPRGLLLKMLFNIVWELLIGVIPVLGDLYDFFFKANIRNVGIIKRWLKGRL